MKKTKMGSSSSLTMKQTPKSNHRHRLHLPHNQCHKNRKNYVNSYKVCQLAHSSTTTMMMIYDSFLNDIQDFFEHLRSQFTLFSDCVGCFDSLLVSLSLAFLVWLTALSYEN